MNYRHLYHAGSFADVFKHVLLIGLIQALQRKDKPLCYLDTHAGIGSYDLMSESAQKTQEFSSGITKLSDLSNLHLPELTFDYLQAVKQWNQQQGSIELRYYPGSPCLVRQFLRDNDRMVLTELHAADVRVLKDIFVYDPQVAVHYLDGYQAIKAFLPPKERRGLVFIDPPFEKSDEFTQVIKQLQLAIQRWRGGVYAVWYPLKDDKATQYFYRQLKASGIRDIICCEFSVPAGSAGMNACAMVVINPPWQWQETIQKNLPALCHALSEPGVGSYRCEQLVPE